MTRQEFTKNITQLLSEMITAGENPVIDYALRGTMDQVYLYLRKKTQCDGINKLSKHQSGCAVDIYLSDINGTIQFVWNEQKSIKWHERWQQLGGKALIIFADGTKDYGHFEG